MSSIAENIFKRCKNLELGPIILNKKEQQDYDALNENFFTLCKSLPESMQTEAMLFLMQYSNNSFGEKLDFFKKFYTPIWSILHYIHQVPLDTNEVSNKEYNDALLVQSMAMFLHSLDDHLHDGALQASHLLLLLRSQAWLLLHETLANLITCPEEQHIKEHLLNQYYTAINTSSPPTSLEDYCDLFRREISTWYIIPTLLSQKTVKDETVTRDLIKAFESFGIAWRIIDDIQDIEEDIYDHTHNALYHALPPAGKQAWDTVENKEATQENIETICQSITDNNLIETLVTKIVEELNTAAHKVRQHGFDLLAEEYIMLAKPLLIS